MRRGGVRRHVQTRQGDAINGAVGKRGRVRRTVLDGRTLCAHASDAASRRRRKRFEEVFGRIEAQAGFAKAGVLGLAEVDTAFRMMAAADTLRRLAGPAVTAP
ncbi:hypothetical protein [Acuticoccus sp.]|uniref:hypothetical protein n=1 Tax=Acuticoccus sp. TaxID=1904378 RepID=UPI003B52A65F